MKPCIFTYTGKRVELFEPKPDDICIEDIAHGLALTNRFVGQSRFPCSVAQHSVFVSKLCDDRYALQGLLHDASEAYLGDVSKWLKEDPSMAAYREAEDRLQRMIWEKFGCEPTQDASVTLADRLMVRFEMEMTFDPREDWAPGYGPLPRVLSALVRGTMKWQELNWQDAEELFRGRFCELAR